MEMPIAIYYNVKPTAKVSCSVDEFRIIPYKRMTIMTITRCQGKNILRLIFMIFSQKRMHFSINFIKFDHTTNCFFSLSYSFLMCFPLNYISILLRVSWTSYYFYDPSLSSKYHSFLLFAKHLTTSIHWLGTLNYIIQYFFRT